MARTIEKIYNQMLSEKENFSELKKLQPNISSFQSFLTDLTARTLMPIWRMLFYIFAVAINLFESVLDLWWDNILAKKKEFATGTVDWFVDKILNFQYGYPIIWNDNQFQYPNIDENAKIVKYVSIVQTNNIVTAKVAKDNSGVPEKLTSDEVTSLQAYLNQIAFLGIWLNVLSIDTDLLDLEISIFVNGTQLNTQGEDIDGNLVVQDAINNYLATLNFQGTFLVLSLIDAIQKVTGVTNVVVNSCELVTALKTTDVLLENGQQVQSYAGYIKANNLIINYQL